MSDGKARRGRAICGMGAAVLLASCATTPEIASDYDHSANFATYHTFTLLQREHPGSPNPLVAIRVAEDITLEMQRRGYTAAADPASADVVVDFTIGAQDRIAINSYPATYGGPILGSTLWGNIDLYQYHEGTLQIDIFDQRTRRPVWHGWVQQELSRKDMEQPAEPINRAVSSVLAKFPPA